MWPDPDLALQTVLEPMLTRTDKLTILDPLVAQSRAMQPQKDRWQAACLDFIAASDKGGDHRLVVVVNGERRCGKSTMAEKIVKARPGTQIVCTSQRFELPGVRIPHWKYELSPCDTLVLDSYEYLLTGRKELDRFIANVRCLVLIGDGCKGNSTLRLRLKLGGAHVFNVLEHIDPALTDGMVLNPWAVDQVQNSGDDDLPDLE
jgi:hypothetical protein